MNSNTSAVVTSAGSFPTTEKNTFRSNAVANNVFGRVRMATNSSGPRPDAQAGYRDPPRKNEPSSASTPPDRSSQRPAHRRWISPASYALARLETAGEARLVSVTPRRYRIVTKR